MNNPSMAQIERRLELIEYALSIPLSVKGLQDENEKLKDENKFLAARIEDTSNNKLLAGQTPSPEDQKSIKELKDEIIYLKELLKLGYGLG